jgi:hypothetical protein
MSLWNWIVQNKQWVFDGFGIAAFSLSLSLTPGLRLHRLSAVSSSGS